MESGKHWALELPRKSLVPMWLHSAQEGWHTARPARIRSPGWIVWFVGFWSLSHTHTSSEFYLWGVGGLPLSLCCHVRTSAWFASTIPAPHALALAFVQKYVAGHSGLLL